MQSTFCLILLVLWILVLSLTTSQSAPSVQSKDAHTPPRQGLGSSLKNLEWDPQKRMAVEKGQPAEVEFGKGKSEDVIKLETTLAVFPVSVMARNGRPVTGLQEEDFVVVEDGAPQQLTLFTLGDNPDRPRSIVLILEWNKSAHTIRESLKATESFVSQLLPNDRVAIVTGDLKLICDFTREKEVVVSKLRDLQEKAKHGVRGLPADGQLEFTTLFAVLRELIDEEAEQPIIIFQADGGEAVCLRDQVQADRPRGPSTKRRMGLADFDAVIERRHATIYPIIPWYYCFNKDMSGTERAQMIRRFWREHSRWMWPPLVTNEVEAEEASWQGTKRVADLSGGSVFCLEVPLAHLSIWPWQHAKLPDVSDRAFSIYSQILSRINQRYVVGYYPTNRARDGKRRKVQIQVRNHPEYVIESRRYYYGPAETRARE